MICLTKSPKALQHIKTNFPKTTKSTNAHDWVYKHDVTVIVGKQVVLHPPTGMYPLPPAWGRGVKNFRKVFAGGGEVQKFLFWWETGGGHVILK